MSNGDIRSLQRKNIKRQTKQQKKKLEKQLKLNRLLPGKCVACSTVFDETDKKIIDEWHIVVGSEEKTVNLYCPACWVKQK